MSGIFSRRWWPLKSEIPWWFVTCLNFNSDRHHIQDYTGKLAIWTLEIVMLCWYREQDDAIPKYFVIVNFHTLLSTLPLQSLTTYVLSMRKTHLILIIRKSFVDVKHWFLWTLESEQSKLLFLPLQSLKLVCHF